MLQRTKKRLIYGALGLLGVAALAAAGGAWWLWGWRLGSLTFHESWNHEQREDIAAMADALKSLVDKMESTSELLLQENSSRLNLEIEMRPLLARSYEELRRTAADGKAPEHDPVGIPMTALAARVGKLSLARELVSRGDDPNNVFQSEISLDGSMLNESSFQSAISCMPLWVLDDSAEPLPAAERIALLEHMLEHGATLTVPQPEGGLDARHVTLTIAGIAAMRGDEGRMAEWLMDKGFGLQTPTERKTLCMLLSLGEGTLPAMRRIVEKYYGELSDTDRYHLLRNCFTDRKDALQKLRWVLEDLHADPNATIPDERSAAEYFIPSLIEDPDMAKEMQQLLLDHGFTQMEP